MKISIITATYNSAAHIARCMASVQAQTYANIEHIIVDGASKDDTLKIIRSTPGRVSKVISEPDHGIYDAMNKGIRQATGDIIGILNSDDFFTADDIIEKIAHVFQTRPVEGVYGDVCFVKPPNLNKIIRYYSAVLFKPWMFRFGFMPPHPAFYVRREKYVELGLYKTDYCISADYELLMRFLKIHRIKTEYLDLCVVTMLRGGASNRSLKSNWILNREIVRACRENGIYTNMLTLSFKYLPKITGLIYTRRKKLAKNQTQKKYSFKVIETVDNSCAV